MNNAVIIGAGHNGLVAACYLALAGLDVRVVEAADHVGGAAISQRVFPGVDARLSNYAYLVSLLPERIQRDIGVTVPTVRRRVSSYTPDPADPSRGLVEPVDDPGIVLCGSGARRGGGVSGIPGHNAARHVLDHTPR